jgi:hypothetical protein
MHNGDELNKEALGDVAAFDLEDEAPQPPSGARGGRSVPARGQDRTYYTKPR